MLREEEEAAFRAGKWFGARGLPGRTACQGELKPRRWGQGGRGPFVPGDPSTWRRLAAKQGLRARWARAPRNHWSPRKACGGGGFPSGEAVDWALTGFDSGRYSHGRSFPGTPPMDKWTQGPVPFLRAVLSRCWSLTRTNKGQSPPTLALSAEGVPRGWGRVGWAGGGGAGGGAGGPSAALQSGRGTQGEDGPQRRTSEPGPVTD